jgi:hypothetical protein
VLDRRDVADERHRACRLETLAIYIITVHIVNPGGATPVHYRRLVLDV